MENERGGQRVSTKLAAAKYPPIGRRFINALRALPQFSILHFPFSIKKRKSYGLAFLFYATLLSPVA